MYYRINHYRLPILLLFVSLTCLIVLTLRYPVTATGAPGGSVLHLRVKVQDTSVAAYKSTKVRVEFLNGDYQPIANDGTRVVELGQAPANSGVFLQSRLTVRRGEPYAETSFTARQPGKLVITARSDGLDSAQTLMIITPRQASLLSRLFETVAYAQPEGGLELSPREQLPVAADNKARARFQIVFPSGPGKQVRISTSRSGGIFYQDQLKGSSLADITLNEHGLSEEIGIISATPGKVEVKVTALLNGPTDGLTERTEINFVPPKPSMVMLDGPDEIRPDDQTVPIHIQLADDGGLVVENDRERHIRLLLANDENKASVTFDPEILLLSCKQRSAQVMIHPKDIAPGNEIRLIARDEGDTELKSVPRSIIVKSAIEKLLISGPAVINPRTDAEYIVRFGDKENKTKAADGPRKIDLTMESIDAGVEPGLLMTPLPLVVNKGDDHAVVKYRSTNSVGRFVLSASSSGLENSQYQIRAVTALQWLVLIALFGGAVGGVARQLKRDLKRKRSLTRRSTRSLVLALKRILGSMVSGLFLYLAYKLGLAQFSGLPVLSIDLEGKLIAFFLSGLGGFAGLVVMHQLAARLLKSSPTPKAAVAQGHLAAEVTSIPGQAQTACQQSK